MSAKHALASVALTLSAGAVLVGVGVAQPEMHRNVRTGNVVFQLTVLHHSEYGFDGSNFFHCAKGEC